MDIQFTAVIHRNLPLLKALAKAGQMLVTISESRSLEGGGGAASNSLRYALTVCAILAVSYWSSLASSDFCGLHS